MRLLCNLSDQEETTRLSAYLSAQNIDNSVDSEINTDWGSDHYGTPSYKVWIIDEDNWPLAEELYAKFLAAPKSAFTPPPSKEAEAEPVLHIREYKPKEGMLQNLSQPITTYLIAICCLLFAWSYFTSPEFRSSKSDVPMTPIYASPVKEALLYDFPEAYEILARLVNQYGMDVFQEEDALPSEGKKLIQEFNSHPYWEGLYTILLSKISPSVKEPEPAPLFEKERQGELWRLVTPIFLHGDIFHLLFNMIWLYVIGKQIEMHLKPLRYLTFILVASVFSNTAQYLVGGPNFLGFSGVLCAMLTYIWVRQQVAPWEGYQLQRSTFIFILIFIVGMFGLQSLSFLLEALTGKSISTSVANTAHLAGAALGFVLGRVRFFTRDGIV